MASLRLTHNKDGTVTVRVGRKVEHIDTTHVSKAQVFEAVKYAALSKGARISDIELTEFLSKQP